MNIGASENTRRFLYRSCCRFMQYAPRTSSAATLTRQTGSRISSTRRLRRKSGPLSSWCPTARVVGRRARWRSLPVPSTPRPPAGLRAPPGGAGSIFARTGASVSPPCWPSGPPAVGLATRVALWQLRRARQGACTEPPKATRASVFPLYISPASSLFSRFVPVAKAETHHHITRAFGLAAVHNPLNAPPNIVPRYMPPPPPALPLPPRPLVPLAGVVDTSMTRSLPSRGVFPKN